MKTLTSRQKIRGFIIVALLAAVVAAVPTGASAANKLVVQDNSTPAVDKFVVNEYGQIGSGTNAPMGALTIKGSTYGTTQLIEAWTGSTSANGGGGFLGFHNNAADALPNANDRIGYFLFGSLIVPPLPAPVADRIIGAGMTVKAEQAWSVLPDGSGGSAPAYISFETTPVNGIGRQERIRINSSGNVGIGQPFPTQKLEVNGGVRLNTGTAKPVCDNTNGPSIRGTIWFAKGALNVADTLEVCAKAADENYGWKPLF